MAEVVLGLLELLNEEVKLYETLLELSEKEGDIIVSGEVTSLAGTVREAEQLVVSIGRLSNVINSLIPSIAARFQIPEDNLTLSRLEDVVDGDVGMKLQKLHKRFSSVLVLLDDRNRINSELIRDALDYINFSLKAMAGLSGEGVIYSLGGKVDQGNLAILVDQRA